MNLQLPPWLRKIQQAWWFQLVLMPSVIAAAPGFIRCAGDNFSTLSFVCFTSSGKQVLYTLGVYLFAVLQHSLGSASFNSDGTENKQVEEVVKADKVHATVAVVPVESPQARDAIRGAVEIGAPVAVVAAPTPALTAEIKDANANPNIATIASVAKVQA